MNELQELLSAVDGDGITDERLAELREIYRMLGRALDSAQSANGLSSGVAAEARDFLRTHQV
jgi:hypothetical protein